MVGLRPYANSDTREEYQEFAFDRLDRVYWKAKFQRDRASNEEKDIMKII